MQDRAVVFIPAENSFYTLNREGTRIWELADGKRTIRKICEILCSEFRVSRDAVSRDAVSFIKHLSDKGLFVYLRKKR
ncbi:MAG: PqqD family protein [Candidatus Omnitrophica bacterium]|nr:PqqD family protein [Candidatus Omnitrophota bacterium]